MAASATLDLPRQSGQALPGEALTRRAVTVITAAIVVMTFAFSVGNVTRLCLDLGITAWIAWLVGPAVDLSVVGLLIGMRFLSLHGYADAQLVKLHRMLRFCGLLTLALNTAGALSHGEYGTALVDAVGPALLMLWSESLDAAPDPRSLPSGRPTGDSPQASGCGGVACCPPARPARPDAGTGRSAPQGNRQAHLPRQAPGPAADRPGPGHRLGNGSPRGSAAKREGRGAVVCGLASVTASEEAPVRRVCTLSARPLPVIRAPSPGHSSNISQCNITVILAVSSRQLNVVSCPSLLA
jgi:uncharacterized membrane protein (Fun14 family)